MRDNHVSVIELAYLQPMNPLVFISSEGLVEQSSPVMILDRDPK